MLCNTHCFSTARIVARTRLNVAIYDCLVPVNFTLASIYDSWGRETAIGVLWVATQNYWLPLGRDLELLKRCYRPPCC